MEERHFRLVLGGWLIAALYMNSEIMLQLLWGVLLFEGITNLRVPLLLDRLRYSGAEADGPACGLSGRVLGLEAERALRLIILALILIPQFTWGQPFWWLPWLVGFALVGAGLSGICPMVLALRRLGLD